MKNWIWTINNRIYNQGKKFFNLDFNNGFKNEISQKTENYAVDSVIQHPTKSILPHWSSQRPTASVRVKIKNYMQGQRQSRPAQNKSQTRPSMTPRTDNISNARFRRKGSEDKK